MQKTILASIYFAFFAFGLFAFASPVTNEVAVARSTDVISTILDVVTDLKSKVEALVGDLATSADIANDLAKVVPVINNALKALKTVGTVATSAGDEISDIAAIVAGILNTVLAAIQSLPLGGLLNIINIATLDAALQALLGQLNLNLPGILSIVASLLALPVGLLTGILGLLLPGLLGILNL